MCFHSFPFVYQHLYLCQMLFHFTDLLTPHFLFKRVGSKNMMCASIFFSFCPPNSALHEGQGGQVATTLTYFTSHLNCRWLWSHLAWLAICVRLKEVKFLFSDLMDGTCGSPFLPNWWRKKSLSVTIRQKYKEKCSQTNEKS